MYVCMYVRAYVRNVTDVIVDLKVHVEIVHCKGRHSTTQQLTQQCHSTSKRL